MEPWKTFKLRSDIIKTEFWKDHFGCADNNLVKEDWGKVRPADRCWLSEPSEYGRGQKERHTIKRCSEDRHNELK